MTQLRSAVRVAALFSILATAIAATSAHAQDAPATGALPEGVIARVHGEDVSEAMLLDRIARTYEHGKRGRAALAELVDDICVAREAARRKVTVTDTEVEQYIAKWDATIRKQSAGKAALADLYETGSEEAEFVAAAREFVLRQKMAREDLGSKPDEELSEHYLKLWLAAVRTKAKVRYKDLPDGVMAMVGEETVGRRELARRLRSKLPVEMVAAVGNELVITVASEHDTRAAGIELTETMMAEAIRDLRTQFAADPQVRGSGVKFDQFLRESRGYGEDDLKTDRVFRARIALRHMMRAKITDEDVRAFWERHRDSYGERVLVRQILVAASAEGAQFAQLSFADAVQVALGAKVEVLEAAGLLLPEDQRPNLPLGPLLTRVAKGLAQNDEARREAGEPMIFTRQPLQGEPALEAAAFKGEIGQLQGPIRSSLGYHLLVVEERRPAPEFEDVAEHIHDDLLKNRLNEYDLRYRADTVNVIRSWAAGNDPE